METTIPQKRSLIAKLAKVMSEISRVKKNGVNQFQRYAYATEADLVEEVREKLGLAGIFIFTECVEIIQRETGRKTSGGLAILITRVKVKHTFCDSDSQEVFELHSYGEGEDSGDKGIYKAMTGAVKYFLAKNFLMSTGDDPEVGNDTDKAESKPATKEKSKAQERPGFSTGIPMEQHQAEQAAKPAQVDHGDFEDVVTSVVVASNGKTKDGKEWTLYKVSTKDHGEFSTFERSVFEEARVAVTMGNPVLIHSEPTPKGNKILGFGVVEVNATA